MITTDKIQPLIDQKLAGTLFFQVELKIRPGNKIELVLDSDEGMTIEQIVEWNKYLEKSLDREKEDFDLTVSSPGVGEPLRVVRQYTRNVGRDVEVKTVAGRKYAGQLIRADGDSFSVGYRERELVPGKKNKKWVDKQETFAYDQVKETRILIRFN